MTLTTSHEVSGEGEGRRKVLELEKEKEGEERGREGRPKTFLQHSTTFLITLQS